MLRGVALAVLGAPGTTRAQPAGPWRVGHLSLPTRETELPFTAALEEGLHTLGEIAGRRVVVEYRFAEGQPEQLPELAAELVRLPVDVIVAALNPVIAAARRATATIPIVMVNASDPIGAGLVASLARPGGNVTGLTLDVTAEPWGKRLQLLREVAPRAARVAVLRNAGVAINARHDAELDAATRQLGLALDLVEVREARELRGAFEAMRRRGADGLLVVGDPLFVAHRRAVVELAAQHRLPAVYQIAEMVEAGGLMSYGPNLLDGYRRAAAYVGKLLRGARPGELPVEQPAKLELVVSLPAARAAGISLPASILIRADHMFE